MNTSLVRNTTISLRSDIFETPKQHSNSYFTSLIVPDIHPPRRRTRQISIHRELGEVLPTIPLLPNLDDSKAAVTQQHRVILKMKPTTAFFDKLTIITDDERMPIGRPSPKRQPATTPKTRTTNFPNLSLKMAKAA